MVAGSADAGKETRHTFKVSSLQINPLPGRLVLFILWELHFHQAARFPQFAAGLLHFPHKTKGRGSHIWCDTGGAGEPWPV